MTSDHGKELAALLQRIEAAPSRFYAEKLRRSGLAPTPKPAALARLSLTTRDELVRDQLAHLPHGTRRYADAGPPVRAGVNGSGTRLLVLTWTAADLARERAAGARVFTALGVTPGMRVANTLPGGLATPGSLLLGDVMEALGALDIPLGAVSSNVGARAAWELFDRVHPDVLVLDASSAGSLLAAAPPLGRPWWQGIVWLQTDARCLGWPALPPAAGFGGWQRTWLAVPEATSFVAHSCPVGRFHPDDAVVVELVDWADDPATPLDEVAAVALTPLGIDTPVLRYLSDLRARCIDECACGSAVPGLELTSP